MDSRVKRAMKAKKKLEFFNPATSLCPICQRRFKMCDHTTAEATLVMKADILAAGCKRLGG